MKRIDDPLVVPGWWVTICCQEDLEELDAELLAEYRDTKINDADLGWMCYPDKITALEEIAVDWDRSGYPKDAERCRKLLMDEWSKRNG